MKSLKANQENIEKQTIRYLLILILQQTGRCGKSTFLLALLKWYVTRGISLQAADTDSDHRTLSFSQPLAKQVVLGEEADADVVREIFQAITRAPVSMVDPRAHQKQAFLSALFKSRLLEISKETALTVPIFPQDGIDVMEDISDTVQLLEQHQNVRFLVVLVPARSKTFRLYEGSDLQKLLLDSGAQEITMPTLWVDTRNHLSELEFKYKRGISAPEAATNLEIAVDPMQRGVLEDWLNELFAKFDRAVDLLVPTILLEATKARIPKFEQAVLAPPPRERGHMINKKNLFSL